MKSILFYLWGFALAALLIGPASAETVLVEGQNYQLITPKQATQNEGKIEVVEVFWYGCPHCYEFEPHLEQWLQTKAEDIVFTRMPGVFRKQWETHAKVFYAAQALGVLDKVHRPLFDAIHREKKELDTDDALVAFVAAQGVDADAFKQAYNSFEVDAKVRQAKYMTMQYGISGVPSMIVNGEYRSSGGLAGSYENLMAVVGLLADKVRAARK